MLPNSYQEESNQNQLKFSPTLGRWVVSTDNDKNRKPINNHEIHKN